MSAEAKESTKIVYCYGTPYYVCEYSGRLTPYRANTGKPTVYSSWAIVKACEPELADSQLGSLTVHVPVAHSRNTLAIFGGTLKHEEWARGFNEAREFELFATDKRVTKDYAGLCYFYIWAVDEEPELREALTALTAWD